MPRYFFDANVNGKLFHDEEGSEHADDQAARDEGIEAIAAMAKDCLPGGEPQKNINIWVRNERGEAVGQLDVSFAVKAPKP